MVDVDGEEAFEIEVDAVGSPSSARAPCAPLGYGHGEDRTRS